MPYCCTVDFAYLINLHSQHILCIACRRFWCLKNHNYGTWKSLNFLFQLLWQTPSGQIPACWPVTNHFTVIIVVMQDLTDEAYMKRHQRLELDERRRKRWDLQRQREINAYEHLRRDDTYTNGQSTCPSRSSSSDIADGRWSTQLFSGLCFCMLWARH